MYSVHYSGTIDFEPTKTDYNVYEPLSLRCVIQNSSEWRSIVLVRSVFNGTVIEPLVELKNDSGGININNISEDRRIDARYELTQDGVVLICDVIHVQCNDTGVYICGNIVGAYTSPVGVKYTNTSVYITGCI